MDDRLAFFTYLSQNPLKGDVIQHGKGLRKIRWATSGKG
ncbi:DNA-binding protein, partial [Leucothrix sargassi]